MEGKSSGVPVEGKEVGEEWNDSRVLAVLPFEDLGGSEAAGPFAAGLHGDLLTELSRLSALTVISRTSVMDYRGGGKTLGEMANELGVGTVVEGAVQHAAGRVRLNVQLVDARRGVQRWAGQYERALSAQSIFELQTELAQEIAARLRVELTPAEKERVQRTPTRDLEAYRLFTRGREHLDQRTEEEVHRALDRFSDAISVDPDYGLAWAGLAEALSLIEYYGYGGPGDVPDALEAARRGVELAPQAGEAYTALGITLSQRREGPPALEALERAVELSPSDAEAYSWLGWLRLVLGEPRKAVGPAARGVELNPRAPAALVFHAEARLATGDSRKALEEAIRARDLQPAYDLARFVEALALYHLDRFVDARTALEEILPRARRSGTPSRAEVQAVLALSRGATDGPGAARDLLGRIREAADPFSAGLVHAALGEVDEAFEAFGSVEVWDSFSTEHVRYFFPDALGDVRRDPRYADVLRDVDRSWGLGAAGEG